MLAEPGEHRGRYLAGRSWLDWGDIGHGRLGGIGRSGSMGRAWPWPAELRQYGRSRRRERHPEVSILITLIEAVGWGRGAQPRSKVSIMIMRPPQHGHGRVSGGWLLSGVSALPS